MPVRIQVFPRYLTQTITYWAPSTQDGWGDETFATPVTISGRWDARTERFIDPLGEETVSNSVVYLNQDVAVDGWLFLGTSATANPKGVTGAYPIRRVDKVVHPKSTTEAVRKIYL